MKDQELVELARTMRQRAYAPYSNFRVGAALLCEDGSVFTGCNVENGAFSPGICAERTAVVKAVSEGNRDFVRLAVAGDGPGCCYPCGVCRQVLAEFAPELEILCVHRDGSFERHSLKELLPYSFDLNEKE